MKRLLTVFLAVVLLCSSLMINTIRADDDNSGISEEETETVEEIESEETEEESENTDSGSEEDTVDETDLKIEEPVYDVEMPAEPVTGEIESLLPSHNQIQSLESGYIDFQYWNDNDKITKNSDGLWCRSLTPPGSMRSIINSIIACKDHNQILVFSLLYFDDNENNSFSFTTNGSSYGGIRGIFEEGYYDTYNTIERIIENNYVMIYEVNSWVIYIDLYNGTITFNDAFYTAIKKKKTWGVYLYGPSLDKNVTYVLDENADINLMDDELAIINPSCDYSIGCGQERLDLDSISITDEDGNDRTNRFRFSMFRNKCLLNAYSNANNETFYLSFSTESGISKTKTVIVQKQGLYFSGWELMEDDDSFGNLSRFQRYTEAKNFPYKFFYLDENGKKHLLNASDVTVENETATLKDGIYQYWPNSHDCLEYDVIRFDQCNLGIHVFSYTDEQGNTYEKQMEVFMPEFFAVEGNYSDISQIDYHDATEMPLLHEGESAWFTFCTTNEDGSYSITEDYEYFDPYELTRFQNGFVYIKRGLQSGEEHPVVTYNGAHYGEEYGLGYVTILAQVPDIDDDYDNRTFYYNNELIRTGFASAEGDRLILTDRSSRMFSPVETEVDLILGAGILDPGSGSITDCAPQSFYDCISNVRVKIEDLTVPGAMRVINADSTGKLTTGREMTGYGVKTYFIRLLIQPNVGFNSKITMTYDVKLPNQDKKTVTAYIPFEVYSFNTVNVDLSDEPDMDGLNAVLSDPQQFKAYLEEKNYETDENTYLYVSLPEKEFEGILTIDTKENDSDYAELFIKGAYPDEEGNYATVISGGIIVNSGNPHISNLRFVANEDYPITSISGDPYLCAVYTNGNNGTDPYLSEVNDISNNRFEGYDKAVWCDGAGTTIGIVDCVFENCDTAIVLNTEDYRRFGSNHGDIFIDCTTGIEIIRFEGAFSPYQLYFSDMQFYYSKNDGQGTDYRIWTDDSFFFTNNYYGIDAGTGMTNGNIRSATVDYAGGSNGEVATNPCIRYPEESVTLGIDPADGLKTRIFSGTETIINSQDLLNLYDPLQIFVCDPSSGNPLGALEIGGE